MIDRSFEALGTTVRVIVDAPNEAERASAAEALILDHDRRLSRFRPGSELCGLNADPRGEVPASALLRGAVAAALEAANLSGGLVDPTLLDALERAGYTRSLAGGGPSRFRRAELKGPTTPATPDPAQRWREVPTAAARSHPEQRWREVPTAAARPDPEARWREITVTDTTIRRPPGLRLDLGGSGKGHAADLVATRVLEGARRWAIDAGGDLRVGGTDGTPQTIEVDHPHRITEPVARLHLKAGAVATSATHARAWTTADGERRHHLLDPATRRPTHTGVISATATAATVLEAETRAKVALLTGAATDGTAVLILDDGSVRRP